MSRDFDKLKLIGHHESTTASHIWKHEGTFVMTNESPWEMRIEGGLSAHFFQPDGSSRPGTDWSVGLRQGENVYHVMVRAYLSDDMTKRARADTQYQGQTVMGYLNELLNQGWRPDQGGELVITIQNPTGEAADVPDKPWWKFW